jgi:hypothetical protein
VGCPLRAVARRLAGLVRCREEITAFPFHISIFPVISQRCRGFGGGAPRTGRRPGGVGVLVAVHEAVAGVEDQGEPGDRSDLGEIIYPSRLGCAGSLTGRWVGSDQIRVIRPSMQVSSR